MRNPTRIGLIATLLMGLAGPPALGDWLNLSGAETAPNIAEIYVEEDAVRVHLEIFVGDLVAFQDLYPDDWLESIEGLDRLGERERLQRFARRSLQVRTPDGKALPVRVQLIEPRLRVDRRSPFAGMVNPMTRTRAPEPPDDKRVIYAELEYPFQQPFQVRPGELTFVPPLDEEGRLTVTIGFIAYHKVVPIIDFRYLGDESRVFLDWDDPWYTRFENPNLKRHHQSALMSFLYVEPYEVRHEILVRVKDLEAWMDLGLAGDRFVEIEELDALEQRVGEFLLGRNLVRVDGVELPPILDRTNYVKVAITGIQLLQVPERLEISTAILGVILTYLVDGLPQEVTVRWDLFTDQIQRVPATATDPAGPLPTFVDPENPVHTWTNFLKNYEPPTVEEISVAGTLGEFRVPVASLACGLALVPVAWTWRRRRRTGGPAVAWGAAALLLGVGVGALFPFAGVAVPRSGALGGGLTDDQSAALLERMLKNVYRAFDFREEETVYDKLALTVSGDLLTEIYLDSRRSFQVEQAGGALAKVKEVELSEARAERSEDDRLAYDVRARWTAAGTVGHWGHVHTRRNAYDAIVTVTAVDGNWKITDLEVLDETRIDPAAAALAAGTVGSAPR